MGVSQELIGKVRAMSMEALVHGISVMEDVVDMLGGDLSQQLSLMKSELRQRNFEEKEYSK